jgi:hypothetical protein
MDRGDPNRLAGLRKPFAAELSALGQRYLPRLSDCDCNKTIFARQTRDLEQAPTADFRTAERDISSYDDR